jgi:hypothetical protein
VKWDKAVRTADIQCVRKVAVHLGFVGIVGPLFFEETVNSKCYCSMLYDFIGPLEEDEINYS